jgi:hypothetical protein
LVERLAALEDLEMAKAAYDTARRKWPGKPIRHSAASAGDPEQLALAGLHAGRHRLP